MARGCHGAPVVVAVAPDRIARCTKPRPPKPRSPLMLGYPPPRVLDRSPPPLRVGEAERSGKSKKSHFNISLRFLGAMTLRRQKTAPHTARLRTPRENSVLLSGECSNLPPSSFCPSPETAGTTWPSCGRSMPSSAMARTTPGLPSWRTPAIRPPASPSNDPWRRCGASQRSRSLRASAGSNSTISSAPRTRSSALYSSAQGFAMDG
ncbi:hypothetical protein Mnod_7763 (plasmid) [Methylobacterium nodulans ORS 2060]|uniref:Uncharacterized protein n=1 Tax=Methylobacterium nodulans (strain LMG 21967 / CNCM I-2342 / ORS 2060) TaxID=460265 RepID=B8IY64_METNO|nr:hypothetical protein Mnod_7763 [Methylobacterium nodulans ORS 2060]